MMLVYYSLIFIFGLAVGSFLNCVIYRIEKEKSFLRGRSYCPNCKHQLAWRDLIPLLSFIALKGKCRYCKERISLQYPLVELVAGILFVLVLNYELGIRNYGLFNFENILNSLFLLLTSCFLIIIFVYDLKHYIIPDEVIYPAIGAAFLYQLFRIWDFGHWDLFGLWSLGFGILPPLFLLAIILFSRGQWMGLGDFKLAIFMGLFLGFPNILIALFLAFFIGAIIGVGLILVRKKTLKSEVPFGPFLVIGTFMALFFGQMITDWYLHFLL
jgi:leader peptidase (prepilin peptidase)/N-methyltransferase